MILIRDDDWPRCCGVSLRHELNDFKAGGDFDTRLARKTERRTTQRCFPQEHYSLDQPTKVRLKSLVTHTTTNPIYRPSHRPVSPKQYHRKKSTTSYHPTPNNLYYTNTHNPASQSPAQSQANALPQSEPKHALQPSFPTSSVSDSRYIMGRYIMR